MALPSVSAAHTATAVTPSDVTVLPATRALYIGTGGTIKVKMAGDGADATFSNVAAGILPIQVTMVYATGTSGAANILALY